MLGTSRPILGGPKIVWTSKKVFGRPNDLEKTAGLTDFLYGSWEGEESDCASPSELDLLHKLAPGGLACWDSIGACFGPQRGFDGAFNRLQEMVQDGTLDFVLFGRHVVLVPHILTNQLKNRFF